MKKSSKTEQRIAHTLEKMRKAMPEIKRQVEVYEKNIKSGTQIKSPKEPHNSRMSEPVLCGENINLLRF